MVPLYTDFGKMEINVALEEAETPPAEGRAEEMEAVPVSAEEGASEEAGEAPEPGA